MCVNCNGYEQRMNTKWLLTIVSAASPASKDNSSILYKFTKKIQTLNFSLIVLIVGKSSRIITNRHISHNCHYGDISFISPSLTSIG